MLSLILSFIAFVVASFFFRRYLDQMEIPGTMTRGLVIFVLALGVAYGVALLVDRIDIVPLFNAQALVYLSCGILTYAVIVRPKTALESAPVEST